MSEICARELRATLLGNQPDWKPTHETTYQHTRRRCDGRRRAQRARAGFEIDHSEPSASRVAISRTAGPDGAQKTSGATSTTTPLGRRKGRAAAETTRRPLHPLRGTAPVMGRCTRYEPLHPIRRGALPTDRVQRTQSQEQTRNPRDDGRHNSARAHPLRATAPVTGRDTRYEPLHPIRRGALPTDRVQRTQSQEQTRNPRDNGQHNSARAHPLRATAPVTGRDTRYEPLHPIRRGALPTDRVQRPESQEQTRNLRDNRRHAQDQATGARSV